MIRFNIWKSSFRQRSKNEKASFPTSIAWIKNIRTWFNLIRDKKMYNLINQILLKHDQLVSKLEKELIVNEETLQNVHDKAKEFCRQQEKEINEIKDQYFKLEEEHNAIIVFFQIFDQLFNQKVQQETENENEGLKQDKKMLAQELDKMQDEIQTIQMKQKQQENRFKKELQDINEKANRTNQEKQLLLKEVQDLQKDVGVLGGHANHAQKIRYINQIKQENACLKQEKLYLSDQLQKETEEKCRYQQVKNKVEKKLPDKQYEQIFMRLNMILNIPKQKDDNILNSVQQLIQELVDAKNELQQKQRELDNKNLKHQSMERDLLLMKQKLYQRENSLKSLSPHSTFHSEGQVLKDTRTNNNNASSKIKQKQPFQFQM